ncbi:MAG: hypothetical protein JXB49_06300, partial [Bacteroidales bacterium]|nr:hypothetical protein [Bacteroidales bacterium]
MTDTNNTITDYFSSYLKTNIRDKSGVKKALRFIEGYFKSVNIYFIHELAELKLQGFESYLKDVKNIHGEAYNKRTIICNLYLLRKWFTWVIEEKGLKHLSSCLIELENIISSYRSDKKMIDVAITEEENKLLNDFIEYERLKGSRLYNEIKYRMKIFFKYIIEHDIDIVRLTFRDAEDYQVYLATLTDEEGCIVYNPK